MASSGTAILIRFRTAWQPGPCDELASLPGPRGAGRVLEVAAPVMDKPWLEQDESGCFSVAGVGSPFKKTRLWLFTAGGT